MVTCTCVLAQDLNVSKFIIAITSVLNKSINITKVFITNGCDIKFTTGHLFFPHLHTIGHSLSTPTSAEVKSLNQEESPISLYYYKKAHMSDSEQSTYNSGFDSSNIYEVQ